MSLELPSGKKVKLIRSQNIRGDDTWDVWYGSPNNMWVIGSVTHRKKGTYTFGSYAAETRHGYELNSFRYIPGEAVAYKHKAIQKVIDSRHCQIKEVFYSIKQSLSKLDWYVNFTPKLVFSDGSEKDIHHYHTVFERTFVEKSIKDICNSLFSGDPCSLDEKRAFIAAISIARDELIDKGVIQG